MQEPADPSPGIAEALPSALGIAAHPSAAEPADAATQPVSDESLAAADSAAPEVEPLGTDRTGSGPAGAAARPEMSAAACGTRLAERFPALFGTPGPVKPIKLRIHVDLQQRAPGEFPRRALSAFLSRHTTSNAYLKALLQAPHRYDLDGQPAGDIDAVHREAAQQELERRRAARRGPPPGRGPRLPHRGQTHAEGGTAMPPVVPGQPEQAGQAEQAGQWTPSAATSTTSKASASPGEHARGARLRPPRGEAQPAGGRSREARRDERARGGSAPHRGPAPGQPQHGASAAPRVRPERHGGARAAAADRADRAPRPAHAGVNPEPGSVHPAHAPVDPAQRARLALVRAWESSPLTQANFCVLMRVSPAELEAAIEQVRRDRPRPDKPR